MSHVKEKVLRSFRKKYLPKILRQYSFISPFSPRLLKTENKKKKELNKKLYRKIMNLAPTTYYLSPVSSEIFNSPNLENFRNPPLISCDESCCNVKFTGFHMNIRLAQLKLFNVWSCDGSNAGGKPPTLAPNWSDDYASRKS